MRHGQVFSTERLIIEERARGTGQPLTEAERMKLIAEPFYLSADQVQNRFGRESHVDPAAGLAVLGTILVFSAFLVAGPLTH